MKILSGERMALPLGTDYVLADIINQCWHPQPSMRPDFASIVSCLNDRLHELQEAERDVLREVHAVEYLLKGDVLLKFPFTSEQNSRPHERYFKLSANLLRVEWNHPEKIRKKQSGQMDQHRGHARN